MAGIVLLEVWKWRRVIIARLGDVFRLCMFLDVLDTKMRLNLSNVKNTYGKGKRFCSGLLAYSGTLSPQPALMCPLS